MSITERKQEPLVWMNKYGHVSSEKTNDYNCPLYIDPPKNKWVGLTKLELIKCGVLPWGMSYRLYEAIEAKLKEKNNGI